MSPVLVVEVLVALVSAVGAVTSAMIGRRVHREVRSPNGVRTGDLVGRIDERVKNIDRDLSAHVNDPYAHPAAFETRKRGGA